MKVTIDEFIASTISIGIFGKKSIESNQLRIMIESYGFFCRIFEDPQETYDAVVENLIQFLIIMPESNSVVDRAENIGICSSIRNEFSAAEFPIIVISTEENYDMIQRSMEGVVFFPILRKDGEDFFLNKLQAQDLVSRIHSMSSMRNMYQNKQSLIKSEREKRAFLYLVTHNVNTPLTVLLNEIHSLSEVDFKDEKVKKMVSNIQKATNQIDMVIQNVLASYKISDGKYMLATKRFNLYDLLEIENIYLEEKAQFKNQTFEFECPQRDLCVTCDENSLKGIYMNLVDNAIKYSPMGGKVKIIVEQNEEQQVVLKVLDSGNGIPKEKQLTLFNRFENIGTRPTGSEKSLGLGLYVVSELCRLNNLVLEYKWIEDQEEGGGVTGSLFSVKFP